MRPAFIVGWFALSLAAPGLAGAAVPLLLISGGGLAAPAAWGQTVRVQTRPGGPNVRAVPPASVDFSGSRRPGARFTPGLSWGPGVGSPAVNFRPGLRSVELPDSVVPVDADAAPSPIVRPSFERSALQRPAFQPGNAEAFGAFEAFGEFPQSLPAGDAMSGQSASGWPLDDRDSSPAAEVSPQGNPVRGWTGRSAVLRRELSQARPVEEIEVESAGIFGRRLADLMTGDLPTGAVPGRDQSSFRSENFSPLAMIPSGLSLYQASSVSPEPNGAFGTSVPEIIAAPNSGRELPAPRQAVALRTSGARWTFKGPVKLLVMRAAKLGFMLSEVGRGAPALADGAGKTATVGLEGEDFYGNGAKEILATEQKKETSAANIAAEFAMKETARRLPSSTAVDEIMAYSAAVAADISALKPSSSRRSSSIRTSGTRWTLSLPSPRFPMGTSSSLSSRLRLHPAAPAGLLLLGFAPLLSLRTSGARWTLAFKRD